MTARPSVVTAGTEAAPTRRLWLGGARGSAEPERDIVLDMDLIAEHARGGGRFPERLPDPYPDHAALEAARVEVTGIVNALVGEWSAHLNLRNGRSYSVDFWRMLLLPWLCETVQRVHARWRSLSTLGAAAAPGSIAVGVTGPIERWPSANLHAYQNALFRDAAFNRWLDSTLLRALDAPAFALEETIAGPRPAEPPPFRPGLSRARRLKLALGYTDVIGTRLGGLALAVFANLLPRRGRPRTMQPPVPADWRSSYPADLLRALDTILPATLPRSYLEDFEALEAAGRRFRFRPGRVRLGTIDYWNDEQKAVAALAREAGEKFAVAQHGGFYGQMRYNVLATEGEYRYGRFLTWGFDRHDDYTGDFVPLPSPYLRRVADRHRRGRGLILVGDPIRFGIARIAPRPRGLDWLSYCDDTVTYLGELGAAPRAETLFRPYANTRTDISDEYVASRFPEIQRLDGDLHARLLSCRLALLCSPNTTMIVAMAANVPLIAFWRPGFFTLSRTAQPWFERLREVGILHDSPEAAAARTNEVWPDIEAWWSGAEVQAARRDWVRRFARNDRLWWLPWLGALWRAARADEV